MKVSNILVISVSSSEQRLPNKKCTKEIILIPLRIVATVYTTTNQLLKIHIEVK